MRKAVLTTGQAWCVGYTLWHTEHTDGSQSNSEHVCREICSCETVLFQHSYCYLSSVTNAGFWFNWDTILLLWTAKDRTFNHQNSLRIPEPRGPQLGNTGLNDKHFLCSIVILFPLLWMLLVWDQSSKVRSQQWSKFTRGNHQILSSFKLK